MIILLLIINNRALVNYKLINNPKNVLKHLIFNKKWTQLCKIGIIQSQYMLGPPKSDKKKTTGISGEPQLTPLNFRKNPGAHALIFVGQSIIFTILPPPPSSWKVGPYLTNYLLLLTNDNRKKCGQRSDSDRCSFTRKTPDVGFEKNQTKKISEDNTPKIRGGPPE